jgi:hypothetical protein
MSVLDNADTVAEAIRPTLDKFAAAAEPTIRKVAETLYEQLLWVTQDYIRENGEWNIGQEIERCRKIEHENTQLRMRHIEMLSALKSFRQHVIRNACAWVDAESGSHHNPVWLHVANVIAKAEGEA